MQTLASNLGMNQHMLLHKLARGNLELTLFVRAASDKTFAKQYIENLYHYMAGTSSELITNAKELGDYLMLLRDIAHNTEDLSLNEFLGGFDVIAENIYLGN